MYFAFFFGAIGGGIAAALYGLRCTIAPAIVLLGLGLLCWFLEAENRCLQQAHPNTALLQRPDRVSVYVSPGRCYRR